MIKLLKDPCDDTSRKSKGEEGVGLANKALAMALTWVCCIGFAHVGRK